MDLCELTLFIFDKSDKMASQLGLMVQPSFPDAAFLGSFQVEGIEGVLEATEAAMSFDGTTFAEA